MRKTLAARAPSGELARRCAGAGRRGPARAGKPFIGRGATPPMGGIPGAEPPLVVYDDLCGPCTSFASAVGSLAGGRIPLVGHHTEMGRRLRAGTLGGDAALDMFWVVEDGAAYGGRAALLPLLRAILSCGPRPHAGELARPAQGAGCGPRPGEAGGICGCRGGPASAALRAAGLLARRGRIRAVPRRAAGARGA